MVFFETKVHENMTLLQPKSVSIKTMVTFILERVKQKCNESYKADEKLNNFSITN